MLPARREANEVSTTIALAFRLRVFLLCRAGGRNPVREQWFDWVEERESSGSLMHTAGNCRALERTVWGRSYDPLQRDLTEDLADTKLCMGEMIFHDPEPSPVPSKEQLLWSYGLSHDQSLDEAEKP